MHVREYRWGVRQHSHIIRKFLDFFFAEHERAVVALADTIDFGDRAIVLTPQFNLCHVVQVDRSISNPDEVHGTLLCCLDL
jgi:hypothetical protein